MSSTVKQRKSRLEFLLEFLGSMNLAITILVAIAIASVIGTVLQQNQPYTSYTAKFGPFWFQVFETLGLYDVYGAVWFLVLLTFLFISTSVCVYRNAPVMLRDMRQFRLGVQAKSLRLMKNSHEWVVQQPVEDVLSRLTRLLQKQGYQLRKKQDEQQHVLAGMKGVWNRPGYIFTHVGIVVICLGGLMDGNLFTKMKEWRGELVPEMRDISANEVPDTARLKPNENFSFRGSISLPENSASNIVFLNVRDGFLVQELPFAVELKDFRIEHYESGQPKSFESDIVIHDDQLDKPLEKTIAVNHPLIYRGYAIYQASFGDGGSKLALKAWPFYSTTTQAEQINATVHGTRELQTIFGKLSLETSDFKPYNIFPTEENERALTGKKFKNFGPSVQFKLRDESGVAREYQNYMLPQTQQGRLFFMSGMRTANNEPFRFLYIPADREASLQRFMKFHALLQNKARVKKIAEQSVAGAMASQLMGNDAKLRESIVQSMLNLLQLFNQGGYIAVDEDIQRKVPEDRREKVAEAYIKVLQNILQASYYELLIEEGVNVNQALDEQDSLFFQDAVTALAGIGAYASPFFLQLDTFEQRESSGLQITRSPGKNVVYLGCVMLIAGIFMMIYIAFKRIWIIVEQDEQGTRILMAGSGNRNQRDFSIEFDRLVKQLEHTLKQ